MRKGKHSGVRLCLKIRAGDLYLPDDTDLASQYRHFAPDPFADTTLARA